MPHHIAFLRAVNVGRRQVKMADLREWLTEDGFTDVETYIQTGNVRVGSSLRSPAKVEARLEAVLRERCGFEVPCIMFTPAELRQVYDAALAIEPRRTPQPRARATSPSSSSHPSSRTTSRRPSGSTS